VTIEELEQSSGGGRAGLSSAYLEAELVDDAQAAYERREEELGEEVVRELERRVILSVLDRKWREHLYEMDYLRDGIGLRAMAQRDPLIEYQREGYDLFVAMMDAIKEETVGYLFNVEVQVEAPAQDEVDMLAVADADGDVVALVEEHRHAPVITAPGLTPSRPQNLEYSAPSADGGVEHGQMETTSDGLVEVDPNASRAERRRAERENRKRQQ
jgi:preprotein translocase subunit SecA